MKTFEWYSRFKSGRRSFEDDPRPGRLSTSHTEETVARLREMICADQRLTTREVGEEVYGYDPETKQMSSQWSTASSLRLKEAQQVKSNVKTMLIAFFDIDRLVHHEYVPRGQTVLRRCAQTSP